MCMHLSGTWAQCYGENNVPVFPCVGKRPRTTNGFHDATCDPFQIEIWWRAVARRQHRHTHGAMGALPSTSIPGLAATIPSLPWSASMAPLPHTLHEPYRGRGHALYLPGARRVASSIKPTIGQGIDVQGRGSYIIVPPSIHPDTGKPYLWDVVDGPDDIEPQPAPDWLLALLTAGAGQTQPHAERVAAPGAPIPLGIQENTLTSLAGAMRRAGATAEEIRAALDAHQSALYAACRPAGPGPDRALDWSLRPTAPDAHRHSTAGHGQWPRAWADARRTGARHRLPLTSALAYRPVTLSAR